MRATIIVGFILHAILIAALCAWVTLASNAMSDCQLAHSYETCVNTLR
jgi:hypothetical protein